MQKKPHSPLSPKDKARFLAYVAGLLITTTILLSALFLWMAIQEKVQMSDNISNQQTSPATVPTNAANGLIPIATWNAGNNVSTNILVTVPPPFISVSSSN